jgi:hypothetical protein
MMLSATFNNTSVKSWRSVLLLGETVVPGENHRRELTWSEILEIGVENFFDFPLHVRLTTLVIPIGLLLIFIGIFRRYWMYM